jgi:hypothetical protein
MHRAAAKTNNSAHQEINMNEKSTFRIRTALRFVPALVHVAACAAAALADLDIAWKCIIIADYPISIIAGGLAWKYDVNLFVTFATIGSLWWIGWGLAADLLFEACVAFRHSLKK